MHGDPHETGPITARGRLVAGSTAVLLAALACTAAPAPANPVNADAMQGWAAAWEPVSWGPVGPTKANRNRTELFAWEMDEPDEAGEFMATWHLGSGTPIRVTPRDRRDQGWVRLGTDPTGRPVVLFARCPRARPITGLVRRSAGVPTAAGCDLFERALAPDAALQPVRGTSRGWSEGISARQGPWTVISRSRAGHRPQLLILKDGAVSRILEGPLGTTTVPAAAREFGPRAAGAADLVLSPDGKLAVDWQSLATAASCVIKTTGNAPHRVKVTGGFAHDLVTIDLATGQQHRIHRAPCHENTRFDVPHQLGPIGWMSGGDLAIDDVTGQCAITVNPATGQVTGRARDSTGGSYGAPRWAEMRRSWGGELRAVAMQRTSQQGYHALFGYSDPFTADGLAEPACRALFDRGQPEPAGKPFFRSRRI